MPEQSLAIAVVRSSHERFTDLVTGLSPEQMSALSYASEWSVAQVASHLGSQAEIFELFLDAGIGAGQPPVPETFKQIWARWDAMAPAEQIEGSVRSNRHFVERLEEVAASDRTFRVELFGTQQDLEGLARMRLGEHALHTWDVAVVMDPEATVTADAVAVLIDGVSATAERSGRPVAGAEPMVVTTGDPTRRFEVTLAPEVKVTRLDDEPAVTDLRLPAEALVRLVYGRLDPDHTPAVVGHDRRLDALRKAFPGF